jgi:predicted transcriptional regulator
VKNSFEGPPAWIIVFCNESPKTIDQIKKHIEEFGVAETEAEKEILQLEKMGILYGEKGKYLTLALPHNANL